MITSLFRKSTPLNYALVVLLMLIFFFIYQFQEVSWTDSTILIAQKTGLLALIFASLFTTNFIAKKNGLSKDSTYTIFFSFIFLLFFPSVLDNPNLIISNFFILLALRRLISLHTLKSPKEKIFDASLWIFVATLFHFWSILFIILVFTGILFHVARDYRNWFLPFIAFFAVSMVFILFATIFDKTLIDSFIQNDATSFEISYFENKYQNLALSIYVSIALFFVTSIALTLSNRPVMLHSSYKKIILSFFIGIAVFLISANKSNDLLLFTFAPLAIMATSHIESAQAKLQEEIVLSVLIICSLFTFFSQL